MRKKEDRREAGLTATWFDSHCTSENGWMNPIKWKRALYHYQGVFVGEHEDIKLSRWPTPRKATGPFRWMLIMPRSFFRGVGDIYWVEIGHIIDWGALAYQSTSVRTCNKEAKVIWDTKGPNDRACIFIRNYINYTWISEQHFETLWR